MLLTYLAVALGVSGVALAIAALVIALRKRPHVRLAELNSRVIDLEESSDRMEHKFKAHTNRVNALIYKRQKAEESAEESESEHDPRPGESRQQWETRIRQKFLHGVR